jgi:uncharacterized protein (DUF4415 family)
MANTKTGARRKARQPVATPTKGLGRPLPPRPSLSAIPVREGWANNLVFDIREPKLAVSLRLDADVLRFFRSFGAGYQTRINEVLKAFIHAREGSSIGPHIASAKASAATNGKRRPSARSSAA